MDAGFGYWGGVGMGRVGGGKFWTGGWRVFDVWNLFEVEVGIAGELWSTWYQS